METRPIRIYNSFQELNNELPPPPDILINPPVQERHVDDRSFADVNSLFSYTKSHNTDSYTDDQLIRGLVRKIVHGAKKAGRETADTLSTGAKLVIGEVLAKAAGLGEEYKTWRAACIIHPEWTQEEQEEVFSQIIRESKARKEEEEADNKRKRK